MVALYNDPQGEKVFSKMKKNANDTPMSSTHIPSYSIPHSIIHLDGDNELKLLKLRVAKLEDKLRLYEGVHIREAEKPSTCSM